MSAAGPATAPAAAPSIPIADQLGARLRSLTGLAAGRHVLSVPLDPEHLGPVRVVAHISADMVRVDLVGAGAASRDALRGALGDLRRDLASAGLHVEVGLGGADDRGAGADQQFRSGSQFGQSGSGSSSPGGGAVPRVPRPGAAVHGEPPVATGARSRSTGLDVLV